MSKKKRTYLGVDFETANLPPDGSPAFPVEISLVLIDAHELTIQAEYDAFIRLPDDVEMSPEAVALHGYTPEFLAANGRDFWVVADEIVAWLTAHGFPPPDGGGWDKERTGHLIPFGQNVVQFDAPILRRLLGSPAAGVLSRYAVDTMFVADFINQAAFHVYGWDGMVFRDPKTGNPSSNLASQMAALGIDAAGHHGAHFDIRATLECYRQHVAHYSDDLKKSAAFDAAGLTLPPLPRY